MLSHVDEKGKAKMVDVSVKKDQLRNAKASGEILVSPETIKLIKENNLKKGDVLGVARIAGIQGAKQTSSLVPLCHPLSLTDVQVNFYVNNESVVCSSSVSCIGKTGVEMEAITAVNIALITIYDMCKAIDKSMIINDVRLVEKTKKDL